MKIYAFFLLLLANALSAQTVGDYLVAPFPSDLRSSADGKHLAWVFNDKGSRNLLVASAPAFAARQITNYQGDDGMDISSLTFTPDGSKLVFVRGNAPNNRGEAANPAQLQSETDRVIYLTDRDGGNLRKIAAGFYPKVSPDGKWVAYLNARQVWIASLADTTYRPKELFEAKGNQNSIRWSPDGKKLAFISGRGDHSFVGLFDLDKKALTFPDPSADLDSDPVWSPDGKWIAYVRRGNVRVDVPFTPQREGYPWSIRLLQVETGAVKEVWRAAPGPGSLFVDDLPVVDNKLLWAAGNQIVFPWEKDGWVHLYAVDVEKGAVRLLTPGEGEVENVALSPDRQAVYYSCNIGDINRRHIWKVNVADAKAEQLTKGQDIEWSPVVTTSGVALLRASATRPAWPGIWNNGVITDIATERFPVNFPKDLIQPRQITITATDGMQIPAQLFLPPNHKPGDKHPAAIFLHGGSRRQMLLGFNYGQYYSNAYALNQYFAKKGYVVISLNFRSGIGYGLNFREAENYGMSGASEVRDLIGAGLYLRSRDDVDGSKIALWGGSYGGYLTAHGLAQASDLFACGVDIHGVHNWNDEAPTFAPWYDAVKYPEAAQLGLQSSPIHFVEGWKSPVLFIHGDDDRNVPFSETVNMIEELRKRNVHLEQLVFPDEVHSFLLHRNWVKAYEATFEFINRQFSK